ncbi:hypothetical protein WA026_017280 [Henosepilachna vigintioctopunctata]|uniref:Major facilitator superfamily (MFS) profile domain-containing protein n=1 Tax=Henosepilachna vigintioctopunctata TaxID=420089 RepID=A0AAW1UPJ8_9CUCU
METDDTLTPINKENFGKSEKTLQYLATFCVCLAAAGAGTVIAWSSPAISELSPPKELNISNEGVMLDLVNNGTNHSTSTRIILTKKEEALIGSFVNLGSLIYAVPSGCIADKFGRKVALYSSGISFIVGWCLIVFANNVPTLLLGRIFGGMGLGLYWQLGQYILAKLPTIV